MFGMDDILGAASDYFGGGETVAPNYDDLSNLSDTGSAADLSNLGGDQGANEWAKLLEQNNAAPGSFWDSMPGAGSSLGGDNSITGIDWIDKILHGMGTSFEKNPLGMLSGGLGIINALDRMKSGNTSPGQAQMANLVSSHMNTGANAPMNTPVKSPYGATAAQLIAIPQVKPVYNGPLTQTAYNPTNRK